MLFQVLLAGESPDGFVERSATIINTILTTAVIKNLVTESKRGKQILKRVKPWNFS